jgi:hypothetical protein
VSGSSFSADRKCGLSSCRTLSPVCERDTCNLRTHAQPCIIVEELHVTVPECKLTKADTATVLTVNDYLQPLNAETCRDHVPILGARYEKTNLQVPSGAPLHIWCERRRHCCEGAAEWNKDAGVSSAALSSHGHYCAGPPASHFILLFSAKHAALSSYRNGAHEIPGNDR